MGDGFMHGDAGSARPDGQMRRDDVHRETNINLGLAIRLFGGMAIQDSRGADFLPRSRKTRAVVAMLIREQRRWAARRSERLAAGFARAAD